MTAGVEKAPVPQLDELVKFEDVSVDGSALKINQIIEGPFVRFNHIVKDVEEGDLVRISLRYQAIKHLRDVEIWRSLFPSDGMSLIVYLPPGTVSLGVNAFHRTSLVCRVADEANGYYEWVLDQAVLPHQAVMFWWDVDLAGATISHAQVTTAALLTDNRAAATTTSPATPALGSSAASTPQV